MRERPKNYFQKEEQVEEKRKREREAEAERKAAFEKKAIRSFIKKSNLKEDLKNLADVLGGKSLFGQKKKIRFDWIPNTPSPGECMVVSCIYRTKIGWVKSSETYEDGDWTRVKDTSSARVVKDKISVSIFGHYGGGVSTVTENTFFRSDKDGYREVKKSSYGGGINVNETSTEDIIEMSRGHLMSVAREQMEWKSEGKA